jgi:hypothetical protein
LRFQNGISSSKLNYGGRRLKCYLFGEHIMFPRDNNLAVTTARLVQKFRNKY